MIDVEGFLIFCGIVLVFGLNPIYGFDNEQEISNALKEIDEKILINKNQLKNDSVNNNLTEFTGDEPFKIKPNLTSNATAVELGEYAYQVSIQDRGVHFCGGALISQFAVLTAAHCLSEFIYNLELQPHALFVTIELGSVTIGAGQSYKVKRMAIPRHFSANPTNQYFSLKLESGVIGDATNIKTINLPTISTDLPNNTKVVVTGYGGSYYNGPTSSYLRKIELHTVSTAECDEYYSKHFNRHVLNMHICAKGGIGNGICQGDSGSPLLYNKEVIGVVSGGNGQCGTDEPDVFTKVSDYLKFIKYEMNYNFSRPDNPKTSLSIGININKSMLSGFNMENYVPVVVPYPIP